MSAMINHDQGKNHMSTRKWFHFLFVYTLYLVIAKRLDIKGDHCFILHVLSFQL